MTCSPFSVTVTVNGVSPEDAAAKFLDALVEAVQPGVNIRMAVVDQTRVRFDVLGTEASFSEASVSRDFEREDNGKLVEVFGDEDVSLYLRPGLGRGWTAGVIQLGAGRALVRPAAAGTTNILGGRPGAATLGPGDALTVICVSDSPTQAVFALSPYVLVP